MITTRRFSVAAQVAGAVALIVLLTRPLIFGGSDRGADFYTHYWYVLHQSDALRHGGPSLYLHDNWAVFSTLYAFYGGTLYAITGTLAWIMGSTLTAYVLTYALAFAASYGGWWWLAQQAGLRGLAAHAPGVVFVTTAYAMTLLYVRGAWPEHVAVAMLPLLAASGLSVLRADRLRPLPALALAVSTVVFGGSHNLTLMCGLVVLAVTAALLLLAIPEARRLVTRAGVLRVLVIVVPAMLVNAWFLLPDLVYQGDTGMANLRWMWKEWLQQYTTYVTSDHLFTLSRRTVEPAAPHYAFALPVLAMGWAVVAAGLSRPRLSDPWLRLFVVVGAVGAGLLYAMTHVGVLRGPFVMLQFSFRLESYINLMVSGAVLAGLVLLQRSPALPGTVLRVALGAIAAFSVLAAVLQSEVHRDPRTYGEIKTFLPFYTTTRVPSIVNYTQGNATVIPDNGGFARLDFRPQKLKDGVLRATVDAAPGSIVMTNIVGVWSLLKVSGAKFVGVDEDSRSVVQLDDDAPPGSTVTVQAAHPPAVVIGRWLSLLGLAGLLAIAAVLALRARAGRRPRTPAEARRKVAAVG